ncbi:hypothetical protein T07_12917 [Trichinella nelsoni]|uniref:Uncharacterized protein n=1 Tax=Trichinella nelsoni TaxID=6336 RepID=A0A0V0RHI1_9BILA|nr:hypothetical protein T07_12917 [Trichinella nelsoni]
MRITPGFIGRSRNIVSPLDTFSRIFSSDLIDVIVKNKNYVDDSHVTSSYVMASRAVVPYHFP